jgi:hypothetical protein
MYLVVLSLMFCLMFRHLHIESRGGSVGLATGLQAGRSGFGGSIPGGDWDFFSSPPRPDRLWAHPASYPMGIGGGGGSSFPGSKAAAT